MKFFIEQRSRPQISILFGKIIFLWLVLVVEVMGLSLTSWAWEIKTHKELTEQAINIKAGILDAYLKENLGLESGLEEMVDNKTVRQWVIEGSDFEDNLRGRRSENHFHDALNNRGLEAIFSGESAIDWGLAGVGDQDGEDSFSWNDAREYYFKALTLPTKTERDEYWGKTFRALGQVMHLLQDSANPSHVRNDEHISFGGVGFVDGLHDYMARQSVSSYPGATFFAPDSALLEIEGVLRNEPFSNLFDTNTYHGGNPGATLGTNVGVAEFTNANFFSDDTIPGQNAVAFFPFPTVFELVPGPSNLPYLTLPRLGSPTFPAARAAKLTGNQAAAQLLLTNTNFDLIGKLQLDDEVYDAQAQNLIPRAIDYSAVVLDYFFRPQYTLEPSTQEPYHHEFELTGTFTPGSPDCGLPIDPTQFEGSLNVRIPIPSDLNFSDGTAFIYYEKSDGSRVLGEQFDFPRSFPPFGQWLSFGVAIPHADVPDSVRWYVVLEGMAGPGDQEQRAILANTDKAARMYYCLG